MLVGRVGLVLVTALVLVGCLSQATAGETVKAAHHRPLATETAQVEKSLHPLPSVDNHEQALNDRLAQAALQRPLAFLYQQVGQITVPTSQSFWQRNRAIINSIKIAMAVLGLSYAIKLAVWLIGRSLELIDRRAGGLRFSVRRATTVIGFAASILKLFLFVFGVVWILNEYKINPAVSTGAIGLIGLIMAGMFQQVVIDFVKGLDIVAGRHYDIGDFIQAGGAYGHVVDFNVKYTRLRTLSGQEFNLPNSQCIPSRRFPDGFVTNYVDLTFKSSEDEQEARKTLEPICRDLNERVEPVREAPVSVQVFTTVPGQRTLRYRVRVLPGCDWVITDHFLPAVKRALAAANIELTTEPTFFFINRIEVFRKLFARKLKEHEIVRETGETRQADDSQTADN